MAVAKKVSGRDTQITALLHDVAEDIPWTPEQLAEAGFPTNIPNAFAQLIKDPFIVYMDYMRLTGSNPLARTVKLADLEHSSDLKKLSQITQKICCVGENTNRQSYIYSSWTSHNAFFVRMV